MKTKYVYCFTLTYWSQKETYVFPTRTAAETHRRKLSRDKTVKWHGKLSLVWATPQLTVKQTLVNGD